MKIVYNNETYTVEECWSGKEVTDSFGRLVTGRQRKILIKKYNQHKSNSMNFGYSTSISLVDSQVNPPVNITNTCPVSIKREEPMYDEIDTIEGCKRQYLNSRLYNAKDAKKTELKVQFGLKDDPTPANPKELAARIAAGKFVIEDKDSTKEFSYCGWSRGLRWRDPAKAEDQNGYEAAKIRVNAKAKDVEDIIVIKDVDAGLAAIQDFEKTSF